MAQGKTPLFRISIRSKLLLASLSLLVLPWLGYQYIQGLETYLRSEQEQRLLDRVAIIASLMDDRHELFKSRPLHGKPDDIGNHIYVRPLRSAIQLDGYADDWSIYEDRVQRLGEAPNAKDFRVDYRLGVWNEFLYLLLQIQDDKVVYRQPDSLRTDRNDHLRIGIQDRLGRFKRYHLATISPGWVSAYAMPANPKQHLPLGSEFRIKGEWQELPGGYNIELRIPVEMIGDKFSFAIADVDTPAKREVKAIIASANTERADALGTIVIPTAGMEALLQRLQKPQSRVWVIDADHRVIGLNDSLNKAEKYSAAQEQQHSFFSNITRLFYRLLLDQPSSEFSDPLSSVSRLDNPAVTSALSGRAQVTWKQTEDNKTNLISAAHPVYVDKQLVGAVAIEETSNSILILQNRAIEALINMSLLAFVLTIGLLLIFATRLSIRVRRLRDEMEASVAADGRVQSEINSSRAGDELGDLGRSFAAMHERLAQYNRYLETMAGKLGHELRTPITIVRSSLDNLADSQMGEKESTYLQRANEGVARLSGILTRMSEATHLEQTIQQEESKTYCINDVVAACVEAYRLAHPDQLFEFSNATAKLQVNGSPDLLAQMLDKLVSNALDFGEENTAITISLAQQSTSVVMSVTNQGPSLPEEMRANLFDSMVSMRQGKSDQPHLGLGLYIVRLIAEYHKGHVEVDNLDDDKGVVFSVVLPLS